MEIDSFRSVLDLGCGTGVAARAITGRSDFSGRITGIDRSPHLIGAAERLAREEGVDAKAEFRAGDSHTLELRDQCLKNPRNARGRQVTRFEKKTSDPLHPSGRMKRAIDSARGRHMVSQRIGTVEPVFGNIRHNKGLARLNPSVPDD